VTTINLDRGDRATLDITDLLDGDDLPAAFGPDDIVRWTAKRLRRHTDDQAFLAKTSETDGGIELSGDSGTITIVGSDWDDVTTRHNFTYFWDLQVALGGDADQIVTLASGTGTVTADITIAAP